MANVQIAQASIDEHGAAKGGAAGDQRVAQNKSPFETNIKNSASRSGGWGELIRCKDTNIAQQAASRIIKVTNSHLVGYDQSQRNTFYNELKKNDWNVDKYVSSNVPTESDCSAYVYAIYCTLIPSLRQWCDTKKNSPCCRNSWSVYKQYGNDLFERYTDSSVINNTDYYQVGDLLNDPSHHIVMVVSTDGSAPINVMLNNELTSSSGNSSVGSGSGSRGGEQVNIPNIPNTVYKLSSAQKQRPDTLSQDEGRKNEFEALRNTMVSNSPGMGRDILMTSELYDSNILKGNQESKTIRTGD